MYIYIYIYIYVYIYIYMYLSIYMRIYVHIYGKDIKSAILKSLMQHFYPKDTTSYSNLGNLAKIFLVKKSKTLFLDSLLIHHKIVLRKCFQSSMCTFREKRETNLIS